MKLPKKIYVKKEKDGDEEFLIAGEKASEIADQEDVTKAGEYILKREVNLVNATEVHP